MYPSDHQVVAMTDNIEDESITNCSDNDLKTANFTDFLKIMFFEIGGAFLVRTTNKF